ncbi:MerR family transcriptional regulator [Humibacillus xanthopallidus]|uniref:MerR family transcriptional regulator n=1 Tax=Humibacillus xanthopallidus TaxID=412689 RepID=UPI00384BD72C
MTDDVSGAHDRRLDGRGGSDDGHVGERGRAQPAAVPVLSWPVGAVAERLGVSTSTLRSWERRYGLGPTHRTGGNHRRYGPVDLQRVQLMVRLTAAGIPAQAAAENVTTMAPEEVARRLGSGGGAAAGIDATGERASDGDSLFGPARSVIPSDQATTDEGTVDAILSAARELDATGLVHLYRQTLRRLDFADAWSGVFVPSLRAIGERWGEGKLGIESEHLASELLQGELRGVVRANRFRVSGTPVLLGSADDEQHHLPLLAVEAELARHGVASLLLGPRVPVRALAQALDRARPPAIFIWASLRRLPTEPFWDLVDGLDWPLVVVIGGPGWPPEVTGTRGFATVVHASDLASAVSHIVPAAEA